MVSTSFECALDRGSGGVPCSGRQLWVNMLASASPSMVGAIIVPVAVFFLPKHCTLWEAMLGDCGMCVRLGGGRGFTVVSSSVVGEVARFSVVEIVCAAQTTG
jgi:hypothetical protein